MKIVLNVSALREGFVCLNVFVGLIVHYWCVGVLAKGNNNVNLSNVYVIRLKINAFLGYVSTAFHQKQTLRRMDVKMIKFWEEWQNLLK